MLKPDEAHVWTDEQLKELESRIAAEYQKAAVEMSVDFNRKFYG